MDWRKPALGRRGASVQSGHRLIQGRSTLLDICCTYLVVKNTGMLRGYVVAMAEVGETNIHISTWRSNTTSHRPHTANCAQQVIKTAQHLLWMRIMPKHQLWKYNPPIPETVAILIIQLNVLCHDWYMWESWGRLGGKAPVTYQCRCWAPCRTSGRAGHAPTVDTPQRGPAPPSTLKHTQRTAIRAQGLNC